MRHTLNTQDSLPSLLTHTQNLWTYSKENGAAVDIPFLDGVGVALDVCLAVVSQFPQSLAVTDFTRHFHYASLEVGRSELVMLRHWKYNPTHTCEWAMNYCIVKSFAIL